MTTPVRLALAAAGSAALYKLAETLGGSGSPFTELYYDAPLVAIAAVTVVLFLALGVVDAARDWDPGWRRVAVIGAAAIALAALPNWFSSGWRFAEAVWRVAAFLAVPAAALTMWSRFRWGPARDDADARSTLDTAADALAPYRGLVAISLGAAAPLGLMTLSEEDFWSAVDNVGLLVALVLVSTGVFYALPDTLRFLSGMVAGRRRAVLLCVGILAAAFTVYVGVDIESSLNPDLVDAGMVAWASVMVPALVATLVYLVSRMGGWAGEGFAVSDAVRPPVVPDADRTHADEPSGTVARRRAARSRRR